MAYVDGLQLVGEVYHYKFKFNGQVLRGSTRCSTLPDAQKWLRRYKANLSLQGVGIRQAPTLVGLLQEWEAVAEATNTEAEIKRMKSAIRTHFKSLLMVGIDQLTTDRVQGCLLAYLQSKGDGPGRQEHSPGGANALLLRLNTLIGWAIRCGYLPKKPYEVKRFKKQQQPRPVVRTAKTKDFIAKVEELGQSPDRKLATFLMLGLGLRESEALGLRWEYLDLEHGAITVGRKVADRFHSKGGEARQLPIPAWLLTKLKARWVSASKPAKGLVMPGPIDSDTREAEPHAAGYTRPLVKRVGVALKLDGITPHRLRASFISALALEAAIPLPQVQKMAGHKHLVTTMRYIEGAEEHVDALDALSKLQGLIPPKEKTLKGKPGSRGVPKKVQNKQNAGSNISHKSKKK